MNRSAEESQKILATFRAPDWPRYPELHEYSRDDCYRDFFGDGSDPFDVQICLDQIQWGRSHQPRKTLFVLTASKLN